MAYPCTKCGACCRRIDQVVLGATGVPEVLEDALKFPYEWDDTGRCSQLSATNECMVYETRPRICRVEEMLAITGITLEDNIKVCNMLMDWDHMPKHFRIL